VLDKTKIVGWGIFFEDQLQDFACDEGAAWDKAKDEYGEHVGYVTVLPLTKG
jgi:hypothetical protein